MACYLQIPTHNDDRGSLSVIEKILPFEIKRVYYMYDVSQTRGGHAHIKTTQAFVCLGGSCEIVTQTKQCRQSFLLDSPQKCLVLEPHEWHTIENLSPQAFLLVLASEYYDPSDYIVEIPND
ncbi:hypothetical protein BBW65_04065 [Helicobacter enhydrae]|uniref:Sugar 3,4-ketoisomerase QdtA cupin domain-containing protein n=1 Tax=Helicobacter enhydrae TaxID=222136 RepID=A0A1B1U5I6_9HELI|nr:FdtA/QdtA family cupin domain-containing protein [Helicobacter enhydrae]ANV98026.1 hypothetical protein BBW65_04065 [Helicobacter enhydrae]